MQSEIREKLCIQSSQSEWESPGLVPAVYQRAAFFFCFCLACFFHDSWRHMRSPYVVRHCSLLSIAIAATAAAKEAQGKAARRKKGDCSLTADFSPVYPSFVCFHIISLWLLNCFSSFVIPIGLFSFQSRIREARRRPLFLFSSRFTTLFSFSLKMSTPARRRLMRDFKRYSLLCVEPQHN